MITFGEPVTRGRGASATVTHANTADDGATTADAVCAVTARCRCENADLAICPISTGQPDKSAMMEKIDG